MQSKRMRIIVGLLTVCFVALMVAYAHDDKTKVKGLITARTGDTIVLKTTNGSGVTVTLNDTKVPQPKGLGIRKKQMSAAVLIPGLKVSVDGTSQDATHVFAKSITFDADDLQTAVMIHAALSLTPQKVAAQQRDIGKNKQDIDANKQNIAPNKANIGANAAEAAKASKRFAELSEYDTGDKLDVHFAGGSVPLVSGILPGKKTATFFPLVRRIELLIDVQVATLLPLVQNHGQ